MIDGPKPVSVALLLCFWGVVIALLARRMTRKD